MTPMRAGLAAIALMSFAIALMSFASAAPASADPEAPLHCPMAAGSEERIAALEDRLASVEDRLVGLSDKLDQMADERRAALDEAKERIEAAVRNETLSPDQVDREVAKALSQAQAKGELVARSAQQIHRSMRQLQGEADQVRQQMHDVAGRKLDHRDNAG